MKWRINTKKSRNFVLKKRKMSINITIARKLKSLEENYPWIIFLLLKDFSTRFDAFLCSAKAKFFYIPCSLEFTFCLQSKNFISFLLLYCVQGIFPIWWNLIKNSLTANARKRYIFLFIIENMQEFFFPRVSQRTNGTHVKQFFLSN